MGTKSKAQVMSQPAGPVYFFGFIGALVYYVQIAEGFWQVMVAFLKALVWPALLVYDALKFLN